MVEQPNTYGFVDTHDYGHGPPLSPGTVLDALLRGTILPSRGYPARDQFSAIFPRNLPCYDADDLPCRGRPSPGTPDQGVLLRRELGPVLSRRPRLLSHPPEHGTR